MNAEDPLEIQQALELMSPYMLEGILLERIWPPCDASKGWLSQLGGWPNFPPDMEWPWIEFYDGTEASLDFVAQIDLQTLPDISMRRLLPSTGMLYFFVLAESHEPLSDMGPDSWRVIHYPGDASFFPPRRPPEDAGWGVDEMQYAKSYAADIRDPEVPRWELFPRCPVRARAIKTWRSDAVEAAKKAGHDEDSARKAFEIVNALDQRTPPPPMTFKRSRRDEDWHLNVEAALLLLNLWRNEWREGLVPLDRVLKERSYRFKGPEDMKAAQDDYLQRLPLVQKLSKELKTMGRKATLTTTQMALLKDLIERIYYRRCPILSVTSLTTLLSDFPEIMQERIEEVNAAHPSYLEHYHRMLGHEDLLQSRQFDEPAILLLQLDSDWEGPRFQWWDMGKLTFWISPEHLAMERFDLAKAEIEGH